MSAALHNLDRIVQDAINQTVLLVNTAAPIPGVVSDQRLRVSDAVITVAFNVRNQLIDAAKGFLVLPKPVDLPRLFRPIAFSSFVIRSL